MPGAIEGYNYDIFISYRQKDNKHDGWVTKFVDNLKGELEPREQIFQIIANQIDNNDPPETALTFKRLKNEGFDDFTIKQLIGQCVAVEIYNVMKYKKPFDEQRYTKNLKNLPKEPSE